MTPRRSCGFVCAVAGALAALGLSVGCAIIPPGPPAKQYPAPPWPIFSQPAVDAVVAAGGFAAPVTSGDADTGSTAAGEKHVVSYAPASTVRQGGLLLDVDFHIMAKPEQLTALSVEVWRETSSHAGIMDLVYRENVLDRLTAHSVNRVTLTSPPQVEIGDYLGLGWTCTADPGNFMIGVGSGEVAGSFAVDGPVADHDFYWASKVKSEVYVPIRGYMTAPQMVVVGDSFAGISGATRTTDTGRFDTWFALALSRLAGGVTLQNWAEPSRPALSVSSRLTDAVSTVQPRVAVLCGGSVDIADAAPTPAAQSGAGDQIALAYGMMLGTCRTSSVRPVIVLLPPRSDIGAVPERMKGIDAVNARLRTLADSNPDLAPVIVDTAPYVGTFNKDGPEGNLWGLFGLYSSDGVTLKKAGAERVGEACADAMSVAPAPAATSPAGG